MLPMPKMLLALGALGCAALFSGCAAYQVPTTAYAPQPDNPYYQAREKAVESPIYNYVPRKREQLRPLDWRWVTWCLAGNEEDGIFGEYSGKTPYSTNINFRTYCSWSIFRNPLHNWDFHVIGSADWKRHYNYSLLSFGGERKVRACSNAGKWGRGKQPFFDIGLNDFKPYLKLDPWITDFYLGWRKAGSFEIKCRADLHKAKKKPAPESIQPAAVQPACLSPGPRPGYPSGPGSQTHG
jgi:hypothetical protein